MAVRDHWETYVITMRGDCVDRRVAAAEGFWEPDGILPALFRHTFRIMIPYYACVQILNFEKMY